MLFGNLRRLCAAMLLLAALAAHAEEKPVAASGAWVNVTANVGGDKWGYAGVTDMAAAAGGEQVIAGVSESGLWASTDAGKSWKKLGEKSAPPIVNRPYQILFDPKNPRTFWECGSYKAPGLFQTADGGQTFVPLGKIEHVDGLGIDFTDPQRKTLVVCHHEAARQVEKSTDGGATWRDIGATLPDHLNFNGDVIVIDARTFILAASGWKQENGKPLAFGIYRTTDGGDSWTRVCDAGPQGPACVCSDGTIYWQTLWAAGLVKSVDQGKSWEKLSGPVKVNPIELPGRKLAAPVEKQLMVSADAAQTWEKWGPELPFKPSGIVYSDKSHAVFAWRSTEAKEDEVIIRWDVP